MLTSAAVSLTAAAAPAQRLAQPVPLEAVAAMQAHVNRAPVDISPDGAWVAHTWELPVSLPRDIRIYSQTGVSLGGSDQRPQAALTNLRTGEVIPLGTENSSSWDPIWSPGGQRVAYYSDADGEAGLWIWERAAKRAARFAGVIVRPLIPTEAPRWSPDGRLVLAKILPLGMTVTQANARARTEEQTSRFPAVASDVPSVRVLRAEPATAQEKPAAEAVAAVVQIDQQAEVSAADLALLDVQTGGVTRLTPQSGLLSWWAFSPDGRYVAYRVVRGLERDTQRGVFDLVVYDVATGERRVVVRGVRSRGGMNVSWSPDSRSLAYLAMDTQDRGECFVAPIAGRSARKLGDQSTPSFDTGSDRAPLWDAKGENLLLLEGDRLWRIEVASGQSVEVWRLRGHTLRDVIAKLGASTAWSPDGGRSLVVSAIEAKSRRSSFHRIDLRTGKYQLLIEDASRFATTHATDVNEATGEFTYVAEDMQRPPDVWLANVRTRAVRQVTRLNPAWERFELGEAQLVEWSSAEGQPLRGTLLLPAGYQAGRRYPLIVFVYGGAKGSEYVNRFGIWGDMPAFNFHVLATRGYAVFYPDAPLRVGTPMSDLMHTVIPGVDKVIELGIADPQRMAVMGQSYGSYCVLALIAQSQRFKAAVITAVTDPTLLSDYLEIRPNGVARGIGYYEHGQGNMGSTPWEYRDRYLNNAPVWLFDRIETPLLMAHGTLDFLSQRYPESVFVALRRLGKEVEYRLYENESHAIQRPANVIDFWQRRLEFLDEHFGAVRDAAAR